MNLNPSSNQNRDSALSLKVNAAIVSNTPGIEGSITYTGGTIPSSTDKWTLVGSRGHAKINNIA